MLKGRCCCVLFRDLQVLLLRDMSGHRDTEAPSTQTRATEDSVLDTAVAELSKDKRDERFSFISYAEGTPVCRICFQGPEQVHFSEPFTGPFRIICLIKYSAAKGCLTVLFLVAELVHLILYIFMVHSWILTTFKGRLYQMFHSTGKRHIAYKKYKSCFEAPRNAQGIVQFSTLSPTL